MIIRHHQVILTKQALEEWPCFKGFKQRLRRVRGGMPPRMLGSMLRRKSPTLKIIRHLLIMPA